MLMSVSRFPPCHFGKIYGILMSLAALFSLLQYLCFTLVQDFLDGDPLYVSLRHTLYIKKTDQLAFLGMRETEPSLLCLQVNIALTLLILVAFIHPANVYLHCRRRAKERESTSLP